MEMQKVNSVLLLILIILLIACFLMGCVEKSSGTSEQPIEKSDMFTRVGYQHIDGEYFGVYHYNEGNVTLFVATEGITAIPDYQLNRPRDYSVVQEALESTKIKG